MNLLQVLREYRLVAVALLVYVCYLGNYMMRWYTGLQDPSDSQGIAFASTMALVFGGIAKWTSTKANKEKYNADIPD
jgi:purine-cytosine permease-like protein